MASFHREKSVVRFDAHVNYIQQKLPSLTTRTTTKLLGTQTSSLTGSRARQTHQYLPRMHRQATEMPPATPLGSALQQFAEKGLLQEYSMNDKSSALDELKCLLDKVTPSLSRNLLGLQFLPAVFSLGYSHWQTQPEQRVICYLPVKLPKTEINHIMRDKVLINLPQRFSSSMNVEPSTLASDNSVGKVLSARKFYLLVQKMLRRALTMKSVSSDRLHFSSSRQLLEITLKESEGWIGEIVLCVSTGNAVSNVLYCCKPLNQDSIPHESNIKENNNTDHPLTLEVDVTSIFVESRIAKSLHSVQLMEDDPTDRNSDYYEAIAEGKQVEISDKISKTSNSKPIIFTESTMTMEDFADVSWFPCNPYSENSVLRSVSKTDRGIRMTAVMIVCKLAQHDWRLMSLGCYHVQTAMYHDAERHLDHAPRWQRNSLQHCVHSLLSTLHKFSKQEVGLPHFGVSGIDLWSYWTPKQKYLVTSALSRLVSSDTALVSLVCRTGNINFEHL